MNTVKCGPEKAGRLSLDTSRQPSILENEKFSNKEGQPSVKTEEMSPDELVLKIDEKLQRAPDPNTESGATKTFVDSEGFEDTNLLTAPGNLNFEPLQHTASGFILL